VGQRRPYHGSALMRIDEKADRIIDLLEGDGEEEEETDA
jgi:hypothetical protein